MKRLSLSLLLALAQAVPGWLPATALAQEAEPAADPPLEGGEEGAAAPEATEQADVSETSAPSSAPAVGATEPGKPAIVRGATYMGFPERFNRTYTDPDWKPSQTVFVSPDGKGDGTTRETAMAVKDAVAGARPGMQITFLSGKYQGCYDFSKETSGTYDAPILLYGERDESQSIGVTMSCCKGDGQACFNFEAADYIAVDGFELVGGKYGVRAVGAGHPASEHSRGIAVLNSRGHDQEKDPFFSGQSDWGVWEGNVAYGAKEGDGHGIYLSNGSDWNIVRLNETFSNVSSDFQINADPASTCKEAGIAYDDPVCDAYAGEGEGGQGASDYFLVEGNYFHHGRGPGANFTSVRRSLIRNNVFGPQARHNVSFWQETDNPKLGSSDNTIAHNLFITTDRPAVQFNSNSTRNTFVNNVLVGIAVDGRDVTENPTAILMEVDDTGEENVFRSNFYISGALEGRSPGDEEAVREDFSPAWFKHFPTSLNHDANDLAPTAEAPFVGIGAHFDGAPSDRNGAPRAEEVDLGPIEID
ncbi:MAG: right-handed parallel beta-helix repeat-containing protein [Hyphomicrobium sp.]|uniref:right-handed parallel beta-helix repeat-containing protein n=1 Tax=Hyphomicrobium sp. TaxID=82 RepID=UPI003D0BCBF2